MGDRVGPVEPTSSKKKGRTETPSYGIIDSQSVKTQ
jgi:putative transposase